MQVNNKIKTNGKSPQFCLSGFAIGQISSSPPRIRFGWLDADDEEETPAYCPLLFDFSPMLRVPLVPTEIQSRGENLKFRRERSPQCLSFTYQLFGIKARTPLDNECNMEIECLSLVLARVWCGVMFKLGCSVTEIVRGKYSGVDFLLKSTTEEVIVISRCNECFLEF